MSSATHSPARSIRLPRAAAAPALLLSLLGCVGLALLVLGREDVLGPGDGAPAFVPVAGAGRAEAASVAPTTTFDSALLASERASDPALPALERALALKELVLRDEGPGRVLGLLDALDPSDARHTQVRALCLSALGRWPDDPLAQERLLRAAARGGARDERLVAIGVLCGWPGQRHRPFLLGLRADPDPAVRDRVREATAAAGPGKAL